jgi:hypothetical protein
VNFIKIKILPFQGGILQYDTTLTGLPAKLDLVDVFPQNRYR